MILIFHLQLCKIPHYDWGGEGEMHSVYPPPHSQTDQLFNYLGRESGKSPNLLNRILRLQIHYQIAFHL